MSKLLCNVLKISGGEMPQMPPHLVARLIGGLLKLLELLHNLQCIAAYFQLALTCVSGETQYLGPFGANFHSRLGRTKLQTVHMHVGDAVQRMQAVSTGLRLCGACSISRAQAPQFKNHLNTC